MTLMQYLRNNGITTRELIDLKKADSDGMDTLKKWAREQAEFEGVKLDK